MIKGKWIMLLFVIFQACGTGKQTGSFTFDETEQGVEVLEDGKPVFFYQRLPKSSHGEYTLNNYIHPLYSLSGDTLTEEFPEDHMYHRGIYWAWTQIYIAGKSAGNGWTLKDIKLDITGVITENSGRLIIKAIWRSSLYEYSKAFLSEETEITIHSATETYRAIDFRISLRAFVPEVEIGGSDNAKGYGGLSVRIKNPDQLEFTSREGKVTPQEVQITAGPWMDFSGPLGTEGKISGLAILCHPQTPNYPAPWILRPFILHGEPSMQNVVYPGRARITVPMDRPITLYYRLIIHDGDAHGLDINRLQLMYEKERV